MLTSQVGWALPAIEGFSDARLVGDAHPTGSVIVIPAQAGMMV